MSIDQQCKVSKRLDLRIQDLGDLQQLLSKQNVSSANHFRYTTTLGEEMKFVRFSRGLWINEDYNITIRVPV